MRKHASVLVAACGRAGWLQHRPQRARLQNTRQAHQGQFEGQSGEHETTRKHAHFMLASSFIVDEQSPGIFLPIRTGLRTTKRGGAEITTGRSLPPSPGAVCIQQVLSKINFLASPHHHTYY